MTQSVSFLLALWGKSYIQNFFDFSLSSLLAPGNIPAMSEEFECTFLFLTQTTDIPLFKRHPKFAQLACYCKIEFIDIGDLIFDGNYTATLTFAYERGMRSRGVRMCHTYFFCLVADYIIANGSFNNLKRYLKAGYSGITTGNFLVVEEYVSDALAAMRDSNDGIISMSPREMFHFAIPNIHPISVGQAVTQSYTHAIHANRLFWKINDQLIIGHFFLRHMLVVKPEIDSYVIGSSCDYSFIPEMCPSGNVAHIQDSDDYFLIEMSPFDYEKQFLQPGPFNKKKLAEHFSQWTTPVHRANAHLPVVYHSEDLDAEHREATRTSALYIAELEKQLTPETLPVRGHFYWRACIESLFYHYYKKGDKQKLTTLYRNIFENATFSPIFNQPDDRFILKVSHPPASIPFTAKQREKKKLKKMWVGTILEMRMFHLSWFDDFQLKSSLSKESSPFVVLAFEPLPTLVEGFEKRYPQGCFFQYYELMMRRPPDELKQIFQKQKKVVIYMTQISQHALTTALKKICAYLPSESSISIHIKHKATPLPALKLQIAIALANSVHSKLQCQSVNYYCNYARKKWESYQNRNIDSAFSPGKKLPTRIKGFIGLTLLNLKCLTLNSINRIKPSSKRKANYVLIELIKKKVT